MLIKRPVGTKNSVNYTVTYSPTSRRRGFFSLKTPVGASINELFPQVLRFSLYNKPVFIVHQSQVDCPVPFIPTNRSLEREKPHFL